MQIPHDLVTVIKGACRQGAFASVTGCLPGRRRWALIFQPGNLPAAGYGGKRPRSRGIGCTVKNLLKARGLLCCHSACKGLVFSGPILVYAFFVSAVVLPCTAHRLYKKGSRTHEKNQLEKSPPLWQLPWPCPPHCWLAVAAPPLLLTAWPKAPPSARAPAEEAEEGDADEVAAKNCADLIDAIYVQERTDDTDAQCEAAKAAWDALTDTQKEMVEGENADPEYFGRDTGDASKDAPATKMKSARTSCWSSALAPLSTVAARPTSRASRMLCRPLTRIGPSAAPSLPRSSSTMSRPVTARRSTT